MEKRLIHNRLPYFHLCSSYACLGLYLPHGSSHLCYNVTQQRRSDGERLKDAGAYQHQDHADLCPHHLQEDRARYGASG